MFELLRYKVKKFFLDVRYKVILFFVGRMPVIVNCTIYDNVMEYNFGKTMTYKPCICFNNKVKRLDKMIEIEISKRRVKTDSNILRKNNSFVLRPDLECGKEG